MYKRQSVRGKNKSRCKEDAGFPLAGKTSATCPRARSKPAVEQQWPRIRGTRNFRPEDLPRIRDGLAILERVVIRIRLA